MDDVGHCFLASTDENVFSFLFLRLASLASCRWKMSNIWFPVPVALFLRRVLNILSTLSITHHYLLPQRSTSRHSHASELRSQPADRVMLGNRRPYAESYIMWTAIVENSLDGILQGVYALNFFFFAKAYIGLDFLFSLPSIASGRLSIPWIRWPARLSLFHPASRSANYVQHPKDQVRVEKMNKCSSDPNSCPLPQGPPEPANSGKEDREDRDEIHRLIQNPVLYNPLRAPRYPIVLCHGAPLLAPHLTEDKQCSFYPRLVWF